MCRAVRRGRSPDLVHERDPEGVGDAPVNLGPSNTEVPQERQGRVRSERLGLESLDFLLRFGDLGFAGSLGVTFRMELMRRRRPEGSREEGVQRVRPLERLDSRGGVLRAQ